jgi:hypothetical protein
MNANESLTDRLIRIGLGIALGLLVVFNIATGTLAIVAGIAAGIALVTGIVGFCAIYALFGISTCKVAQKH